MFKKFLKKGVGIGIFVVLTTIAIYALSWIATCGLVKLITMCFGWTFSWAIATGVWLVIFIAKSIFKSNVTVSK